MPDAPVLGARRTVTLDDTAFGARFHGPLVHESVRAEQAARRRGTASTKTRGMVSGGGAKPWRQKGTGRARAGSNRSPVWTGGGVVFGPQPRSYTTKVNRKERRAALRSALSLHAERGSLALLDPSEFSAPRTRQALELLAGWGQIRPTLVVLDATEDSAALSFRNLARVAVLTPANVGVADLLGCASLLLSQAALDALTARANGAEAPPALEPAAAKAPKPKRRARAAAPAKPDAPVTEEPPAADAPAAAKASTPEPAASAAETEASIPEAAAPADATPATPDDAEEA